MCYYNFKQYIIKYFNEYVYIANLKKKNNELDIPTNKELHHI